MITINLSPITQNLLPIMNKMSKSGKSIKIKLADPLIPPQGLYASKMGSVSFILSMILGIGAIALGIADQLCS